jgi:hypothetical protein
MLGIFNQKDGAVEHGHFGGIGAVLKQHLFD